MAQVLREEKSNLEYIKEDNGSKNLIVLLHGYGASMQDLHGLSGVINPAKGCDWIFPNGHLEINMGFGMLGRGWFPVDMAQLEQAMQQGQHRDFSSTQTNEFIAAVEKTNIFLNEVIKEYDKVIIGGFSQGSMLTSFLSLANSEKIDGFICYSGTLVGKEQMIKLLETAKKFPFLQSHGKSDPVLGFQLAKNQYDLFSYAGFEGEFIEFNGAHEIPMNVIQKSIEFVNKVFV